MNRGQGIGVRPWVAIITLLLLGWFSVQIDSRRPLDRGAAFVTVSEDGSRFVISEGKNETYTFTRTCCTRGLGGFSWLAPLALAVTPTSHDDSLYDACVLLFASCGIQPLGGLH